MIRAHLKHATFFAALASTCVLMRQPPATGGEKGQIARMMNESRVSLRDMSASVTETINTLRQKYKVPVCFVSVSDEKQAAPELGDEEVNLRTALDEDVQAHNSYAYALVSDRLILHPKSGPFTKVVGRVHIRNVPRLEAMMAFVEHLKETHTEFGNLGGPGMKGDPRAPLYTDLVSLREEGTVLEHFAALLGDDPNVVFSVVDGARPATRIVVLEQLKNEDATGK